ncbi:MAG TPA: YCF48-related protein [Pyrinomonadaceae bacterium]|jgi:photosystem II stability/assembly factor-like uncharacterized protein|nr:YCF48-related protein [Pyrinomonadaceae bacterium]
MALISQVCTAPRPAFRPRLLLWLLLLCFGPESFVGASARPAAARTETSGTWSRQSSGTMTGLRGVYFTDADHGWAVGGGGSILRTDDGGRKWLVKRHSSDDTFWDVYFTDRDNGWLLAERALHKLKTNDERRSYLLKTSDGGLSWTRVDIPGLDPNILLTRAAFATQTVGYVFGEYGTLFKTPDGGATWEVRPMPTRRLLLGGVFFADGRGWLVSAGATLLQTADNGESWREQGVRDVANVKLHAITFGDQKIGWAVGSEGLIVKTTNGGNSWRVRPSPSNENLFDVSFINATEGWAVGSNGTILHTADGGETWTPQKSGTTHPLARVFFDKTSGRGFAVGFGGTVLTYTPAGDSRLTER